MNAAERPMRPDELFGKGPRCTKHRHCAAVDGHPGPRFGVVNATRQALWFLLRPWLEREK